MHVSHDPSPGLGRNLRVREIGAYINGASAGSERSRRGAGVELKEIKERKERGKGMGGPLFLGVQIRGLELGLGFVSLKLQLVGS